MIEKFTPEELEVIKRELIERENMNPLTKQDLHKYISSKLEGIFGNQFIEKSVRIYPGADVMIARLSDMCFKNYEMHFVKGDNEAMKACVRLPYKYKDEYMEMCNEIIEIIKKHNKEWDD